MNSFQLISQVINIFTMILLIIFSASLILAAGHLQNPTRQINNMKKFDCKIESAQNGSSEPNVTEIYYPLSDEFLEILDAIQKSWKSGRNFHKKTKKECMKGLTGSREDAHLHQLPLRQIKPSKASNLTEQRIGLPNHFDARKKWSTCTSLQSIRDQGPCGSCWAVAATAAFTDRLCIASKAEFNGHLSAANLMNCCDECSHGDACAGGNPHEAWNYFHHTGIVTGGDYESDEGCQPYEVPESDATRTNGPTPQCTYNNTQKSPQCKRKCQENYKDKLYQKDIHRTINSFKLPRNEEKIMKEIYKNGPVQASFNVYEDFLSYKSGVYAHVMGNYVGSHAVKVIGWGTEEKADYWLVANSWNSDWGDNGYFKIKRGSNECGFEAAINAGMPETKPNSE